MIPWQLLDSAPVPDSTGTLHLYQRGKEFSIRVDRLELMNSRVHGSEDALAEMACAGIAERAAARVLIGGLGMGFTVAAALERLRDDAEIVVAELSPAVVAWNRGPLMDLAGRPLESNRVTVREVDVAQILRTVSASFDAILLDVDNGPEALTRRSNRWLYGQSGLAAAWKALRPGGVLGIWSVGPNQPFAERLRQSGYVVEESRVRARATNKGAWHTIWIAKRDANGSPGQGSP